MKRKDTRNRRNPRAGFTLIELLIVVGIIALLITVLTVAIMPMLSKRDTQATMSLLQQVGSTFIERPDEQPSMERFERDLGRLSGRMDADDHVASSQMILFYLAPPSDVWEQSRLYGDANYDPQLNPDSFSEFTRRDDNGLPYLVDAWENPIWYEWDPQLRTGFIVSMGKDGEWSTDDDILYMASRGRTEIRENMSTQ